MDRGKWIRTGERMGLTESRMEHVEKKKESIWTGKCVCSDEKMRQNRLEFERMKLYLMSYYCKCPVTVPHGAVGWSAVCDCGISCSYSLNFC